MTTATVDNATDTLHGGRLGFVEDGGVERFVEDRRPIGESADRIVSRMRSPLTVLDDLDRRGSGRFDLLVDSADDARFIADPSSETGVAIAPNVSGMFDDSSNGSSFVAAVEGRGSVPVTRPALNQLAALLGVKGGWGRYEKMDAPVSHLLRDLRGRFGVSDGEPSMVLRTNGTGTDYKVEAVFPADADRTDPLVIVGAAFEALIERWGDSIRGVEMLNHSRAGVDSFRILFGDPVLQEAGTASSKRLYPMLDLTLSDTRRVHPSASLGLWRMWCLNGCSTRDFDLMSFRSDSSTTGDQLIAGINGLVDVAAPLATALGTRLQQAETTPLGLRPADIISMIEGRQLIGSTFAEDLRHALDNGGGDGGDIETDWDMLNLWTDTAKRAGSLPQRAGAENRALQYVLAPGGFTGVAERGFDRNGFRDSMTEMYQNNVGDPKATGLARAASLN